CDADFSTETPEALAPRIPVELRAPLLSLLYTLAGDEPVRRRIAEAYAGLWQEAPEPEAPPRQGSAVGRRLVRRLTPHHVGRASQEDVMQRNPYRGEPEEALPIQLSPLRKRVERICVEYRAVIEAVESVIVGKRDVIERVLTAMAARGHVLLVDVP